MLNNNLKYKKFKIVKDKVCIYDPENNENTKFEINTLTFFCNLHIDLA